MKRSKTRKVLAVFLATIMVLTAAPISAFAYDYNYATNSDANISTLVSAINKYEQGLASGTIYANMADAYDAYVNAKKAYDSYVYGGRKNASAANSYGTALEGKLTAISAPVVVASPNAASIPERAILANDYPVWSNNKDGSHTMKGNNGAFELQDTAYSKKYSNKVLWLSDGAGGDFVIDKANFSIDIDTQIALTHSHSIFYMVYGTVVLLYDGDASTGYPRFPVMGYACQDDTNGLTSNEVYSMACTTPNFRNDVEFGGNNINAWVGGSEVDDKQHSRDMHFGANINPCGWGYINGVDEGYSGHKFSLKSGDHEWKTFSSSMIYDNNQGFAETVKPVQLSFKLSALDKTSGISSRNENKSGTSGYVTYLVNYSKVKSVINDTIPNFAFLKNIANYTEDYTDVKTLMGWIDEAYKFNPSDSQWGYSSNLSNALSGVEKKINDIVANTNANNINANTDPYGYNGFKSSIESAQAKLEAGNTLYTSDSWGKLEAALANAQAHFAEMSNLYSGNYGSLKSNLDAALTVDAPYDAPAGLDTLADFSELEEADSQFKPVSSDMFTVASLEYVRDNYVYPSYLAKDRANISHTEQSQINAERDTLNALFAKLKTADPNMMDLGEAKVKAAVDNTDKYDLEKISELVEGIPVSDYSTEVKGVAGYDVMGVNDVRFMEIVMETLNSAQYDYTVTINGKPYTEEDGAKDTFHYGDEIVLPESKNGYLVEAKAAETEAPLKSYVKAADKLVVRGDMTITSCDAPQTEASTLVTFRNFNTGKVMAAQEIANGETLELASVNLTAPAFYTLTGEYTVDGAAATQVTANGGTIEVWVHVAPISTEGVYKVTINGVKEEYKYDKAVPVAVDGAKGYKDGTGEIIWIGEAFTLRVLQDVEIVPVYEEITVSDGKSAVSYAYANAILANGRTRLYGSFATAEDVEIVTQGVILDVSGTAKELTLANVNNANKMFNYSATQVGKDMNQYCISIPGTPKKTFQFVTYVTYKDGDKDVTVYSAVRTVNPASEQA